MSKYLVVWGVYGVVVQSEVETNIYPHGLTAWDWMMLAAESEELEVSDCDSWELFCVIDYPTTFYQ